MVAALLGLLTTAQVLAAAPPGQEVGTPAAWWPLLGAVCVALFAGGVAAAPRFPNVAALLQCLWVAGVALALGWLHHAGIGLGPWQLPVLVVSVVVSLLASLAITPGASAALGGQPEPHAEPLQAQRHPGMVAFIRMHLTRIAVGILLLVAPMGLIVSRSRELGPEQAVFVATVVLFLWLLAVSFFLAWPMLAEEADRLHLETRIEAEASRIRRRHARRRASRLSARPDRTPPGA